MTAFDSTPAVDGALRNPHVDVVEGDIILAETVR